MLLAIIGNFKYLEFRQDVGALWENFVIAERIKAQSYTNWHGRNYFWRTYQQQEIDWVEETNGEFSAFEFKWNEKKKNKKLCKTFLENYNVKVQMHITPNNIDDFLAL